MAFGFGFNKQKVLAAAEKFVQQGKLPNAIAEYEKVLKSDAKDLTVNNTIGDLYSRLGDSAKAIECFKIVGDAYAAQGFTVKGIAMYKKITKLQPSVDASLKLAELYTQQGLFNDARAQYLQVAEEFMKNGDLEQAVRLFQKVLEMDPENVPMRIKLAEVYVKLGKKTEAWELFSAAAEALRGRGSAAAAEDVLKRMLVLDPSNSYVLLLRGKAALENDDPKSAVAYLEKAPDIDSHAEGLRDLLKAYLQIGPLTKAAPIAEKLLTVHNDTEGLFLLGEGCARLGEYRQALEVYTRHADRLLATDPGKLLASLHTMITHVRDDSAALESVLSLLNKAGETTHLNEVVELLAHSSVKDGNLERARDLYRTLAASEPQNQMHLQNYQQIAGRGTDDGLSPVGIGITAEEGMVIIDELEATAPVIDQSYPDEVAIALRGAITDADLFLSYNLPDKAMVPLQAALPMAPRDIRLNQRLAALHTRFQHFSDAAVCCRSLETVFRAAGYADEAVRYGELAKRYELNKDMPAPSPAAFYAAAASGGAARTTKVSQGGFEAVVADPQSMPAGTFAARPEFSVQELAVQAPGDASFHVSPDVTPVVTGDVTADASSDIASEVSSVSSHGSTASSFDMSSADSSSDDSSSADLSAEWEHSLTVDEPVLSPASGGSEMQYASSNPEIVETVEEVRFYLEHFMTEQARSGIEKLETLTRDPSVLDPLRKALESAQAAPSEPEAEIAEINADEIEAVEMSATTIAASVGNASHPTVSDQTIKPMAALGAASPWPTFNPASAVDAEGARGNGYEEMPLAALPATIEPAHAGITDGITDAGAGDLNTFVADLESSLGDSFPQAPEPVARPAANRSAQGQHPPQWPVVAAPMKPQAMTAAPATIAMPSANPAGASLPAVGNPAGNAVPMAMSYAPVRPLGPGAQTMHPPGSVDLSEMFGELKQELEEDVVAGDDDPETHYNLGVAFREMGLLDEAIAELQKVCSAIDRGKPFAQPVQTYTWLAQCFLDKGVPQAAIRWYEKALNIPGLDDEARLAINYELGSACESALDKPAALRHFTNVYGTNIDYRDVAERIQALKS